MGSGIFDIRGMPVYVVNESLRISGVVFPSV